MSESENYGFTDRGVEEDSERRGITREGVRECGPGRSYNSRPFLKKKVAESKQARSNSVRASVNRRIRTVVLGVDVGRAPRQEVLPQFEEVPVLLLDDEDDESREEVAEEHRDPYPPRADGEVGRAEVVPPRRRRRRDELLVRGGGFAAALLHLPVPAAAVVVVVIPIFVVAIVVAVLVVVVAVDLVVVLVVRTAAGGVDRDEDGEEPEGRHGRDPDVHPYVAQKEVAVQPRDFPDLLPRHPEHGEHPVEGPVVRQWQKVGRVRRRTRHLVAIGVRGGVGVVVVLLVAEVGLPLPRIVREGLVRSASSSAGGCALLIVATASVPALIRSCSSPVLACVVRRRGRGAGEVLRVGLTDPVEALLG